MTGSDVAHRVKTVILGATQARGFALVLFYDDGPDVTDHREAIIHNADPRTAAAMLEEVADDYYQAVAQEVRAV